MAVSGQQDALARRPQREPFASVVIDDVREAALALVRRTTAALGLPIFVNDVAVLARIAQLVQASPGSAGDAELRSATGGRAADSCKREG